MTKFKAITLILLWFISQGRIMAQHQEIGEEPAIWGEQEEEKKQHGKLLDVFRNGEFNGHFRYFFMHTNNEPGLSDYYANAAGGGLRFETAALYNFQFAVSGFYIFNLKSSDFTKLDPVTGASNRYELALFDVENPGNTANLDRLEEFYLKYNYKKSHAVVGRQLINTPFINLQDGRMRPTAVQGLYFKWREWDHTQLEGGVLNGIAPRGTIKYYSIGESIGIYPVGVNPDGSRSGYKNNVSSDFIALAGITHRAGDNLSVQVWNAYVDNVFNSALLQVDYEFKPGEALNVYTGAQFVRQDKVNAGGNEEQNLTFFSDDHAMTFGARAGLKSERWDLSLNYNRITPNGRYLMPREWGRDPFFTFLPRERSEGFSDVHAIVAKASVDVPEKRLKLSGAAGYIKMPDVLDFEKNKFGIPSYVQTNLDIRYALDGFFTGLEVQFLLVAKWRAGEVYDNQRFTINKVNMQLYNLVLNYRF